MSLPSNYVRVDYIQSSSKSIDGNFKISSNGRIILREQITTTTSWQSILGTGGSSATSNLFLIQRIDNQSTRWAVYLYAVGGTGGGTGSAEFTYDLNSKANVIDLDGYNNRLQINNSTVASNFKNTFSSTTQVVKVYYLNTKLYYEKIYESNVLKHDLIPVKRNDGVLGLYDLLEDVFYYGDASFTYGHELIDNIELSSNPLQFNLSDNVELQANFKIKYQITLDYDETLGSASYEWGIGNNVLLSATPNSNAQFKGWYINNVLISNELNTSYEVSGDTTFEARFERVYDITTNVVGDGAIGINRQPTDLNIVEIYVIPNANRHFVKYEVDGEEIFETPITLTLTQDISIVAYFEEDDKYHISASANIDNTSVYVSNNDDYSGYQSTLWARPFPNYVFEKWSDGNTQNPRTISVDKDITLVAIFKHIIETNGIYQYRCYVKDQLNMNDMPKAFMVVDKFTLKQDYLTNANSSIEVLKMADNVNNGDVIVVYNPKGETIYQGVITSISDLKITTSQMQSFYKGLWIYHNYPIASYVEEEIAYLLNEYAQGKLYNSTYVDGLVAERLGGITIRSTNATSGNLPTDLDQNGNQKLTQYDMEKFIYKLYQDYGIVFEFTINISGDNYVDIKVPTYTPLSIGNNHYAIMNLSPIQTIEETNKLVIYGADKTYRTTYIATTNGIVEAPTSLANRFNITNTKVVYSDDNVSDLISANLPTQMYNHKITFDLLLKNNLYQFNEFKLGMPLIVWYNGTDYYNSVLTGRSFSKQSNQNVVQVSYTCGLVRTTLTTKLTLNKV